MAVCGPGGGSQRWRAAFHLRTIPPAVWPRLRPGSGRYEVPDGRLLVRQQADPGKAGHGIALVTDGAVAGDEVVAGDPQALVRNQHVVGAESLRPAVSRQACRQSGTRREALHALLAGGSGARCVTTAGRPVIRPPLVTAEVGRAVIRCCGVQRVAAGVVDPLGPDGSIR